MIYWIATIINFCWIYGATWYILNKRIQYFRSLSILRLNEVQYERNKRIILVGKLHREIHRIRTSQVGGMVGRVHELE